MKTCSKCGEEKQATEFYKDSRKSDGLMSACRKCHNSTVANWAERNSDKRAEKYREWAENNKDRRREVDQARRLREVAIPDVKRCSSCGEEKTNSEFHKKPGSTDGLYPLCKACRKLADQQRRTDNAETLRQYEKARASTPKRLEAAKSYYAANKEACDVRNRRYALENKGRVAGIKRKYVILHGHYSKRLVQAFVAWADQSKIEQIYQDAKKRTQETGVIHHVDHVVPLKSKLVCGLHTEANLQVLSAVENLKKRNFYWPDMP